ncbi:MAG: response regulator [Myxococcaceae bacterium]
MKSFGQPPRVLVGLKDPDVQAELAFELMREGYLVDRADSGLQMTARLLGEPFELVVVDAELPADNVLEAIAPGAEGPCVIVIAREISERLHHDARRLRAVIVDNFAGPKDLADCAVSLVPPNPFGTPNNP